MKARITTAPMTQNQYATRQYRREGLKRIDKMRKEGMTDEEIAKKFGISLKDFQKIESNARRDVGSGLKAGTIK